MSLDGRGVPDHAMALNYLNHLRREMRNMTYETPHDGTHDYGEMAAMLLDQVERLIKNHAQHTYRLPPQIFDRISDFKPQGWSGGGHLHWYSEEDPRGDKGCRICSTHLKPGQSSLEDL